MRGNRVVRAVVAMALLVSGCSAGGEGGEPAPSAGAGGAVVAGSDRAQAVTLRRGAARPPASRPTGWGPTHGELRRAERLVGRLPLPALAGQLVVARYTGRSAPVGLVRDLHLGGVIVMGDNVSGTAQVRRSNRTLKRAVARDGRRWPVFVGVDQEGGVVERVKGRATRFPAFMSAGAASGDRATAVTRRAYTAGGRELVGLGFSTAFAPVADVTVGPADPTIGARSAGARPGPVAARVRAAVRGFDRAGLLPVVKHFPGHGSVTADSHTTLPVQSRSLRKLRRTDLVPFTRAVDGGVSAVMTGHLDVRAVDPGVPSSLSRRVVTGLLRRELGFRGLVVTDALDMAAVSGRYGSAEAAVRAVAAGNDVLLMPPDPAAARDGLVGAVRSGRLHRAQLERAASRQVALLLHQEATRPAGRPPGSARAASYRLSASAVTVVSGRCRGRLVGDAVRGSGTPEVVARFHAAARRAGLETGRGTTVSFTGYRGSARSADVVVATDTPYVLGRSQGRRARIALFGDTPGAMRALVEVLTGERRAPGRLPVRVRDVPRRGC